jgi:murein L,D-transpeptidase YafK
MARSAWRAGVVAVIVVGLVGGCQPPKRGWQGPPPVADEERLAWAADEPWFVVVRTSCRTLDVYEHGDRVRSYPAVFGLGGTAHKLHEGDHKTPTGLYTIVAKRRHGRWQWFMLLDYPNMHDVNRYVTAVEAGRVPMLGSRQAGVGGAVGIHGTDKPELNRKGVDWTFGCISLDNVDVDDLARLVPVGTPVLIED